MTSDSLRDRMAQAGWDADDVATRLDVSRRTVQLWLSGARVMSLAQDVALQALMAPDVARRDRA